MGGCCGFPGGRDLTEKLNFDVRETEAGVTVEVTPKDPAEAGTLKGLVKGLKAFACRDGCC